MSLLSGTVEDILNELDSKKRGWRSQLREREGASYGVNQQVQRVTLPDKRVFYAEEARPGDKSVSVIFVPPKQGA